jgi:hypothetical protein
MQGKSFDLPFSMISVPFGTVGSPDGQFRAQIALKISALVLAERFLLKNRQKGAPAGAIGSPDGQFRAQIALKISALVLAARLLLKNRQKGAPAGAIGSPDGQFRAQIALKLLVFYARGEAIYIKEQTN